GAGSLRVDYRNGTMLAAGQTFRKGDVITIDGASGQVLKGSVASCSARRSWQAHAHDLTLGARIDGGMQKLVKGCGVDTQHRL
ncbi:hypothetical protein H7D62_016490, partial [Brucella melitensis]|uniref:hypothetical protein n=1 Tax=Brucella melitensis TaxID=29459 RepID=UPI001AA019D2